MENLALNYVSCHDFSTDDLDCVKNLEMPFFEAEDESLKLAKKILRKVMQFRRSPTSSPECDADCPKCHSLHLPKIFFAVKNQKPISFILPAFPGKSPNPSKVLSTLPDKAEQLALQFLQQLCEEIKLMYEPGARITLCSDGRVFSDVVGMREMDVTDYQQELDSLIRHLNLCNISTFHLDEICQGHSFSDVRVQLLEKYGSSLESLKEKVLRGSKENSARLDEDTHRMYCGITRFLVEDAMFPGQAKSRSAIQKECRTKAYEVIRRSNAWTEFLSERFPEAVRLSIHPQACGSPKLGIRLIGNDSWMTPWHGVAVETNQGYVLLKRSAAEALGAELVRGDNGRPSHFRLLNSPAL